MKQPRLVTLAAAFGMASSPLLAQLPRGVPGDYAADKVFGKPDFTEVTPYTTVAGKLFLPHGVIVDRSDPARNKMYVYDSGNNRILGLDLNACLLSFTDPLGCTTAIVIGQPTPGASACNGDSGFQGYPVRASSTASSLCGERENQLSISEGGSGASMAVDAAGSLYVADFWNNRVLKYDRPFETDVAADDVWGQTSFEANDCNKGASPDATTLCFSWGNDNTWTAGVDIDAGGNLWVADSGNNRVLRFPPGSKTADLVLGQPTFTSTEPGEGVDQLAEPSVVRVSPATGRVYVSDTANDRVLVYRPPLSSGMSAESFGTGFGRPQGVDLDPTEPGAVWIANTNHNTIELWNESGVKVREIGLRDDSDSIASGTGSVGIDSWGSLYVAVTDGAFPDDVLYFNKGSLPGYPTRRLFGHTPGGNRPTSSDLGWSVEGVVVADGQLIVADNDRLLFWNAPASAASGQAADGYAAGASGFGDFEFGCCGAITADAHHHLFVVGSVSTPAVIHVYQLPLTLGAQPFLNLFPPFGVLGGGILWGSDTYSGVGVADTGELWLSQSLSNRVFRLRNPLTNPVVDLILGQHSPSDTVCNRGGDAASDTLCRPGLVQFDRRGNLWVSDHSLELAGNLRLLEYPKALIPSDNASVLYAPAAAKSFPESATWQPAFDAANHMVVGYNPYGLSPNPFGGWFPGVYSDPLSDQTTPDGYLQDYFSMAYAAVFDENDNLYIADLDRSRVLFYENPTASLPAITGLAPTNGRAGNTVILTGRNLSGASAVSFNGASASFRVDSDTQLTATVPEGATTGPVQVASPLGGACSLQDYFVGVVARPSVQPCCPPGKTKKVGPH